MAEIFDDDGFSLKPKNLHRDAWFYEGKKGLTIVVQLHGTIQSVLGTVEIPWSRLKPSIERYLKFSKSRAKRKLKTR